MASLHLHHHPIHRRMEVTAAVAGRPPPPQQPQSDRLSENIKRRLQGKGVAEPTPKMLHALRKKHRQKSSRKSKRLDAAFQSNENQLSAPEQKLLAEETRYRTISREYKRATQMLASKTDDCTNRKMVGRPWEGSEKEKLRKLAVGSKEFAGEDVKSDHLRELGMIFEERRRDSMSLLLADDVQPEEKASARSDWLPQRLTGDMESVQFLIKRLSSSPGITPKDWKFAKIMEQSKLQFTEAQMLTIVGKLGHRGCWKHAKAVVEWVYNRKEHQCYKSRFVYTKLLAVLGKARRPHEALQIFDLMRGDCHIYPDMAAYHSISVTLGQAGLIRELMDIVECMRQKPSKGIKNVYRRNWDPTLQPDLVVLNSVLNACIASCQWKGVSWVFEQLRKSGIRPSAATYGLAMEVMLHAKKYEKVHELFWRMEKCGEVPQALTYRVLVKTFWEEDRVDEAIEAVRDMEDRGIIGIASVYYELGRCLCNKGRWQEAIMEIENLRKVAYSKPIEFAFTGMIKSAMDGGHVDGSVSIFKHMELHYSPNIGVINAMVEVYGRNDMFTEAKELFEKTKSLTLGHETGSNSIHHPLTRDMHTYVAMLKACACAQQWDYFEHVYKEMAVYGYQLRRTKDTLLLVEASRAGKWHVLEHAFDAILESEEIPHPSLFTEMVCQNTSRGDIDGASRIINSMAYAPFQVSQKEWNSFFKENRDRMNHEYLRRLLDMLLHSDMADDISVSNLIRSLQSFCCSASEEPTSATTSIGTDPTKVSESPFGYLVGVEAKIDIKDRDTVALKLRNLHRQGSFASSTALDGWLGTFDTKAGLEIDFPEDASDDCLNGSLELDDALDTDTSVPEVSDLPSADEILESWRESMTNDGREYIFPSLCWL